MTTIAYRNGVMVSDSMSVASDIIRGVRPKIHRLHEGRMQGGLVGFAGDSYMAFPIVTWINEGCRQAKLPRVPDGANIGGLIVMPDGEIFIIDEKLYTVNIKADYYAIGSGNELALGAMAHGADAVGAVTAALRHDICSGGPLDIHYLDQRRADRNEH